MDIHTATEEAYKRGYEAGMKTRQVSPPTADEYIKRSDLMRAFADRIRDANNSDFARVPNWNDAVQIVEEFPAAYVIPKEEVKDYPPYLDYPLKETRI